MPATSTHWKHIPLTFSGVNSGAEIALIGGGWTALVGLAGFGAAIYNNNRTLGGARREKIRDWRAQVYVDVLAAVQRRQMDRTIATSNLGIGDAIVIEVAQRAMAAYTEPDWYRLDSQQFAFGSREVFQATVATSTAHATAMRTYRAWTESATEKALDEAITARKVADAADDALGELMRRELQDLGHPKPSWEGLLPPDPVTRQPRK